jgi:hypothetical protein
MAINLFLGRYVPTLEPEKLWAMQSDQLLHFPIRSGREPRRLHYVRWHKPLKGAGGGGRSG